MGQNKMKVALVCDWLTNVGGAEKVLLYLHKKYPEAPIYTSQYNPKKIDWFIDANVHTGWLRIFPSCLRRFLGVFRQRYFSHLDLSDYDLVISVTGAEAKSVKVPNGLHISYCHVPTQYYWQMYDQYVENPGFGILNPLVRFFFKLLVRPLRKADYKAAQNVDQFVTISEYAKEQIKKYYKREAVVVHPPVEVKEFKKVGDKKSGGACLSDNSSQVASPKSSWSAEHTSPDFLPQTYYITTSRQVNWKRLDLAVETCMKLQKPLLVVGEGTEHRRLVKMAAKSDLIKFLPLQKRPELAKLLAGAKGYIFPSLEPFGIAPVEALAASCPVIAFSKGGTMDYIIDGKNGVLFNKQSVKSLEEAISRFEKIKFSKTEIAKSADKFNEDRFGRELKKVISDVLKRKSSESKCRK